MWDHREPRVRSPCCAVFALPARQTSLQLMLATVLPQRVAQWSAVRRVPGSCSAFSKPPQAHAMADQQESSASPEWKLWYWPGIKGRGEYIRLVFEEAGVPYEDCGQTHGFQGVVEFVFQGGNKAFPLRAPPAIVHGDFTLCNTPVVTSYLGKKFGLYPSSDEDAAHVDMIVTIVADAVGEGRLAFHPKDFYASHKGQEEESKPYIKQYGEQRLPKYLQFFESILARNRGGQGFLIGDKITVADLSVYHYLCAAEQHYKQYYDATEAPLCKAFKDRIAARPRIAAYLASPRCLPWDTDSMM